MEYSQESKTEEKPTYGPLLKPPLIVDLAGNPVGRREPPKKKKKKEMGK